MQFREHPSRFLLGSAFKKFLLTQPKDTVFHFHSVFIPWFLPAMRLLKKHGFKRVILTPHGQYVDAAMQRSVRKRIFFYFFDRKILRIVDKVHVIGRTEINSYIASNAKKYVLIPNGCRISQSVAGVRKQFTFGYLGRLSIAQKGLDILLKAYAFYRKQGGTATLHIAGAGEDESQLRAMCRELQLGDELRFVGKVFGKEKCEFFCNCSFFLHPSRWDVIPTACMEAVAAGVPLVISRATNLDTYVEKYQSGLVYPDDGRPIQALAEQMAKAEKLFADTYLYKKMRSNALDMVAKELNWDVIAKRIYNLLYSD